MSKADEELKARQVADERTAHRHSLEAQARPDAMHRAVHFLLHQAIVNNNDIGPEARHHLATLDREMADSQKLVEIGEEPEKEQPKVPVGVASPGTAAQEATNDPPRVPRQSRRFSGRG
jgi:hypothetical protein